MPRPVKVLADYIARRKRHWAERPVSSYLFVSSRGNRLDSGDIHRTFYALSRQIGLRGPSDSHGPRLHDLRHRFATIHCSLVPRLARIAERRLPILSAYLGHVHVATRIGTQRVAGADARGDAPARTPLGGTAMTTTTSSPPLLERFFTQRLMQQRQASPHTISSYRDTFRLFLRFVEQRLHKPPSRLQFEEIDAPLIVAFLDHLEKQRGLSIRSRNLRLTAIHSFFRYAAFEAPDSCRADPARTRHPQQALHADPGSLSDALRKSTRCSRRRIGALGSAGAITLFSWSLCRRVCACRK